ncbi:hypothetical protein QAD02_017058 [Eretmocerus hayati]|uniref:Uncharacterized protein n=1 Tax=Eretmocerus hayati TaxID=131215 RepID=A0ACC2PE31_9HYME|nr:hypothetical protein QAD02_017058 [Eretmocerus hayati]
MIPVDDEKIFESSKSKAMTDGENSAATDTPSNVITKIKSKTIRHIPDSRTPRHVLAYWTTKMDADQKNRTNQCNPNHPTTGPGHDAGYKGTGTKPDLDNHSRQCNPGDAKYGGGQKK